MGDLLSSYTSSQHPLNQLQDIEERFPCSVDLLQPQTEDQDSGFSRIHKGDVAGELSGIELSNSLPISRCAAQECGWGEVACWKRAGAQARKSHL